MACATDRCTKSTQRIGALTRADMAFDTSGKTLAKWHHRKSSVQPARSNPPRAFLFRRCNCLSEEDSRMTRIRRRAPVYQHVAQPITNEDYMAPTLADIQALARSRTETAIHVLSSIMIRETANPFARVAAAKELINSTDLLHALRPRLICKRVLHPLGPTG